MPEAAAGGSVETSASASPRKSRNPLKRAAKGLATAGAALLAPFSCTGRQMTQQVRCSAATIADAQVPLALNRFL